MALIVCRDLSLGYEGRTVLSGLSFCVEEGDYLFIIGENGSGKTTLMRTLLGLRTPMSGSIEVSDGLRANEIGYLPQQTQVRRDFPASVREIVLSGCQGKRGLKPFYSENDKARADANIKRLGLGGLRTRCFRELSGGQQQRVLLARALCATEKVLLLDEPVSGLDPGAAGDMYDLIGEINERDGIAVIMISHDMDAAFRYARHILYIGDGMFFGAAGEFFKTQKGKYLLESKGGGEQ